MFSSVKVPNLSMKVPSLPGLGKKDGVEGEASQSPSTPPLKVIESSVDATERRLVALVALARAKYLSKQLIGYIGYFSFMLSITVYNT